ncbi:MAG: DUF5979 domain-containing protein [Peptostreptococcaceae bacterium]|nr:DUF5979 domain-containing protein [Peptostreptococcaceae bacterium]
MQRNNKFKWLSYCMAMLLVLNIFFPPEFINSYATVYGKDKLEDIVVTIKQNGAVLGDNAEFDAKSPLDVFVQFKVPVKGAADGGVMKGDILELEIADNLELIGTIENLPMFPIDQNKIRDPFAIASLSVRNQNNKLMAFIDFNGNDSHFEPGVNDATLDFNMSLRYSGDQNGDQDGKYYIEILDKTFTFVKAPPKMEYALTKSGAFADSKKRIIDWTVVASVKKDNFPSTLKDMKFVDELSGNVGSYVPNSFTINGDAVADAQVIQGNTIQYLFADDIIGDRTIKFQTMLSDDVYFTDTTHKISNTAKLTNASDHAVKEAAAVLEYKGEWIKKGSTDDPQGSSAIYNPKDRTLTWTITANDQEATLKNAVITDQLEGGLTYRSSTLQKWNGTAWSASENIVPQGDDYILGTIDTKVMLTIVTKVPDADYSAEQKVFKNRATLRWDGGNSGTGYVDGRVGYNALEVKTAGVNMQTGQINWNVKVNQKQQNIPDLRLYHVFVHGDKQLDLTKVDGVPSGFNPSYNANYVQNYGQQYIDGTFNRGDLTFTHHKLTVNGKVVGDILEITGFAKDKVEEMNFSTKVVSPRVVLKNSNEYSKNTGVLFSANTGINMSTANASYASRMLYKELLNRDVISNPSVGVNSKKTREIKLGFDYAEKAAIFRISLNANGIDFKSRPIFDETTNDFTTLGKITLKDTLPAGWEFDKINGKDFLIFEGNINSGGIDTLAKDTTPDEVAGLNVSLQGEVATFTFDSLDKPYVVLIKARPNEAKQKEYFSKNGSTTAENTVNITAENSKATASYTQVVEVDSQVISKDNIFENAGNSVTWTVDYKPSNVNINGQKITDTLSGGIDLRTDSKGQLLLEEAGTKYFTIKELVLQADGTYTEGVDVPVVIGQNVSYDLVSRTLTFKIAEPQKAYRFKYLTDITGSPKEEASNSVKLTGALSQPTEAKRTFIITEAQASAMLSRSGWLKIVKVDGATNAPLANAQFSILLEDGTVFRTGKTQADGTLFLKALPAGQYKLKETAAPAGYDLDSTEYSVLVEKNTSGRFTTTINGNKNILTVQNFKDDTGKLKVTNKVTGSASDPQKDFPFKVEFSDGGTYTYIRNDGTTGKVKSGDSIQLKHGQSFTIVGMPNDLQVTITETPGDYKVTPNPVQKAVIVAKQTKELEFVNTKDAVVVGDLKISNEVRGTDSDPTKPFTYQITLPANLTGEYEYVGEGGAANGKIRSGGTFTLKDKQAIIIKGLPVGTEVMVTETPDDYKVTPGAVQTGTVKDPAQPIEHLHFINTKDKVAPTKGQLTISNEIKGDAADLTKKFTFTITLPAGMALNYKGNGVPDGTLKDGDTFELTNAQSITIGDIPFGTEVSVTETPDDYTVTPSATQKATVDANNIHPILPFVNTKNNSGGGGGGGGGTNPTEKGNLEISNTVSGAGADLSKPFHYKITFDGDGEYTYEHSNGTTGKIKSGDNFILKNGEKILIKDMPIDLVVTIVEDPIVSTGYIVDPPTGTIVKKIEKGTVYAPFTNTKDLAPKQTGDLIITNTVTGPGADKNKDFTYTIVTGDGKEYEYEKSDGSTGKIRDGETITLKDGERVIIKDLPKDLPVTVTETVDPDYTPNIVSESKVIVVGGANQIDFVNVRKPSVVPTPPPSGGGGNTGGSPQSPVRPDRDPAQPNNPNQPTTPPTANTPNDTTTIEDNRTPLANQDVNSGNRNPQTNQDNVAGEVIEDNVVPKAASPKSRVPRVSGAPKTGIQYVGSMLKGSLGIAAAILFILILIDEYRFRKYGR